MQGFDFFCHSEVCKKYGEKERNHISQELKKEETIFFQSLRQSLIQSAAGLDMLIERHDNADLVFITAFLTGTNEDPEDRAPGWGKKYFKEGEVDSFGNIRKEGEEVSEEENNQRNKSLEDLIYGIGYNFVRVLGHYDTEEHSYCVINYAEDTNRFINDMEGAAALWWQDSVLICPRKDHGPKGKEGRPFLYYPKNNQIKYATSSRPSEAITDYYTVIGRDHISYPFDFSTGTDGPAYANKFFDTSRGLYPIRRGYEGAWVASNRMKLREAFGNFQGW